MQQPSRPELGNQILVIRRPIATMVGLILLAGLVIVLFLLSTHTSALETLGAVAGSAIFLIVARHVGSVRVFEFGIESNGSRMSWEKLVAYRLSWALGSQKIVLIERGTKRELWMFLCVFQSDSFREAVGDRARLDALVKVGLP